MKEMPIRRALLSVSDKSGIIDFASGLRDLGVEILSTGGTARALEGAGIRITTVEAFTGFPEMLDGRVKTLHPRVHAGILHRRDDPSHVEAMERGGLLPIDLVAVNLYPFEETVAREGVSSEGAIEEIDIGGPTILRGAAKNHAHVTVICQPSRYPEVLAEMRAHGGATTPGLRARLALEVFRRTAAYDAAIARFLESGAGAAGRAAQVKSEAAAPPQGGLGGVNYGGTLPARLEVSLPMAQALRYGENPHQAAALYGSFLERFRKLHGKELSYNNILDLAAAEEIAAALGRKDPAVAIVKHSNPCGAARGDTVEAAWRKALATDPVSASGGIIASSGGIDRAAAEAMEGHFIEILVAPGFEPAALDVLRRKKNRILLEAVRPLAMASGLTFRWVPGGALAQTADDRALRNEDIRVVTRRAPSPEEMEALRFGWEVARFVKSNAIVYAGRDRTLGIGAGQMSRVDSARIGAQKASDAGIDLRGSAVASDAFFPFADGLLVAAGAGATAAIQPGGSVRDDEVIAAADSRGMAMVLTGVRHFRH